MTRITWSAHAMQRIAERFPDAGNMPLPPSDNILRAAVTATKGRLRWGPMTLVCKRNGSGAIVVTAF